MFGLVLYVERGGDVVIFDKFLKKARCVGVKDWSCGYQDWLVSHPDVGLDEKVRMIEKYRVKFDCQAFIQYYDGLSVVEWKSLILDMADRGFDIRCVLHYKKLYADEFTLRLVPEVLEPLYCACGVDDFVDWKQKFWCEPWECSDLRQTLMEKYSSWGLPIPQYWRDLLWT